MRSGRRISGLSPKIPFLPESRIEDAADTLLNEFRNTGWGSALPVPIDEILELHLDVTYEIADLQTLLGQRDVLGAVWFNERTIRVDRSLDPSCNPSQLGRYRFTLAHEVGHWRLHREYFVSDQRQSTFLEADKPEFVCRSTDKPPQEWQADYFAAALLMPRKMLISKWKRWRGNDMPAAIRDMPPAFISDSREANERATVEQFCRPLARQFEVSAEAMRIRLEKLGLVVSGNQMMLL